MVRELPLDITLAGIRDTMITADARGRVTLLNAKDGRLTGWFYAEAVGQPLVAVFRIVNAQTRCDVF